MSLISIVRSMSLTIRRKSDIENERLPPDIIDVRMMLESRNVLLTI